MSEGATSRFYVTVLVIIAAAGFGYSVGHIRGATANTRRLEMEIERMTSIASRQEIRLADVNPDDRDAHPAHASLAAAAHGRVRQPADRHE
jgi:hypothetical protein